MKSSIKGGNLTKKQIPNSITVFRMVFSAAMLFCRTFSPAFWVFYFAAGFSDFQGKRKRIVPLSSKKMNKISGCF
jgi:phosphatidylglycerophosphate synthase